MWEHYEEEKTETVMFKPKGDGWTLGKEIIGTIIAILPFAILFFVWMSNVQTRLTVLEEARNTQRYRDESQDSSVNAAVVRIERSQTDIARSVEEINKFLREQTYIIRRDGSR